MLQTQHSRLTSPKLNPDHFLRLKTSDQSNLSKNIESVDLMTCAVAMEKHYTKRSVNRDHYKSMSRLRTPERVDLRLLLDGGLVLQGGEQGGVGRHAVEAAVVECHDGRFMRRIEERLGAGDRVLLGTTGPQRPAEGGRR